MGNNKVISVPREQLDFDKYNGAELMYHTFHISTFASFFSVYLKCENNKNCFLHFLLLKILLNGINYRIQVWEVVEIFLTGIFPVKVENIFAYYNMMNKNY